MRNSAAAGPPRAAGGPRRASAVAFFDLDGTLVADKSLLSFYRVHLQLQRPADWRRLWDKVLKRFETRLADNEDRAALNRWFYETYFQAMPIVAARAAASTWFERSLQRPDFFFYDVMRELFGYRAMGFGIVLVTGSFREVVAPVAELVGADHVLAAPLEVEGGLYTGRMRGEPMIGHGKRDAVRRYLTEVGVDAGECYGYGDDPSDIPFLECVGSPVAVLSGSARLAQHARECGWRALVPRRGSE